MKVFSLYYKDMDYTYYVSPWRDDYIEYLWEKETGRKFNILNYKLYEPKDLYSKLEDEWTHNKLDEHSIDNSSDFYNYLLARYEEEACDAQACEEYWRAFEKSEVTPDYDTIPFLDDYIY